MTRCLTAAVLAAALLAVLGYRRGREMAEPEDVPTISLGGLVRFQWHDSVSEGVVKGIGWQDSMYIVHAQRVPDRDSCNDAEPWRDAHLDALAEAAGLR